jgi:hypothetical protein
VLSVAVRYGTVAMLMIILAIKATSAEACPDGTYYLYEDATTIYCKRENDGIGDNQATRAAILKSAMAKLGYPYHEVNTKKGEYRCLHGDVSMCPTHEHPGGATTAAHWSTLS